MKNGLFIWLEMAEMPVSTSEKPSLVNSARQARWFLKENDVIQQAGLACSDDELERLADLSLNNKTIVLLPGETVLYRLASLPVKKREAYRSIPYQFENDLLQPVEEMVFCQASELPVPDKQLAVCVWSKEEQKTVQEWLDNSGIQYFRVIPDYLLLLASDNSTSQTLNSVRLEQRMLYLSASSGGAVPVDSKLLIPDEILSESVDKSHQQLVLEAEISSFSMIKPVRRKVRQQVGLLPKLGAAALFFLLVNAAVFYLENRNMQEQLRVNQVQIESSFRQLLPDSRMVDPVRQLEQLQVLKQKQQGSLAWIEILEAFSKAVSSGKNTALLQGLEFNSDQQAVIVRLKADIDPDQIKRNLPNGISVTKDGGKYILSKGLK